MLEFGDYYLGERAGRTQSEGEGHERMGIGFVVDLEVGGC